MKILQITDELPPYILGGSGRIAWETAKGLALRGHDMSVLTAAPAGTFPDVLDGVRITTVAPLSKRWAHYRSVFSIAREDEVTRIIDQVKPDVIHSHGTAWQLGYRWIPRAIKRGIPCFYTAHGVMHVSYGKVTGTERPLWLHDLKRARWTYNPLRNVLVRIILRRCTMLCVSDALREYLERTGEQHIQTLHNGIDLGFWKRTTSQADARKQLGLPIDGAIFLMAGRIGTAKGSDAVLNALPEQCTLVLSGDVEEREILHKKNQIQIFRKQGQEQMRLLYTAADATLVPSIYLDPFPTVNLESMACETPVVATIFGGSKEAVIDGETGWVLNPTDTNALTHRLEWARDHRDALREFGKAGRTRMEKEFSIEKYLDALERIYKNL